MKVRSLLLVLAISSFVVAANAGDISSFVNLGFSSDSRNFMFGIYGVTEKESIPHAEAYIINVSRNSFQPGGQLVVKGTHSISLGQDGSGALYNILHTIEPQIAKYKIDHLNLGRLVYVLFNGQEPKAQINFHDFNTDVKYELTLIQSSRPAIINSKDGHKQSEFSINLVTTQKNGNEKKFIVGRPGFFRDYVDEYSIRQVILSPDERSLLFVIEKQNRSNNSLSTSYMVETVDLY